MVKASSHDNGKGIEDEVNDNELNNAVRKISRGLKVMVASRKITEVKRNIGDARCTTQVARSRSQVAR